MYHDVSHLLSRLINGPLPLRQIYFASASGPAPELAYQVDFPRLEIVLEGELTDMSITAPLIPCDVLYVPAGGWNIPQWQTPVTTLSILFGKQQLGFSVVHWDGQQHQNLTKQHVARRGPRIGSFLLQTLNEMQAAARAANGQIDCRQPTKPLPRSARQPNPDRLPQPRAF